MRLAAESRPKTGLLSLIMKTSAEHVTVGLPGFARQLFAYLEALLLSLWLGSMAFFSFIVAPTSFQVLGSRHLAGQIVTANIVKLETLGLIIAPLLILIQFLSWRYFRAGAAARFIKLLLLVVMAAATALSRFWITPAMQSLRDAMGGIIDDVPAGDPLRIQFNGLHQYSVVLMSAALLSGLAVLFFAVRSWIRK